MRFTKDITIGEIPTASNSNYSALFQADGQVRKRTLGSIITQDIDAYLSGISVAFPTSVFNIADSSITPSQPNLVVSLKNQLAGTVFAAPETLNGTPSFRKLADVDLDQTTVAFQDDMPDVSGYISNVTNSPGVGRRYTSASGNIEFTGIPVIDTRSTSNDLGSDGSASYIPLGNSAALNSGLTPLFHYRQDAGSLWVSSVIMKGWTGNYGAWMISGNAHSTNSNKDRWFLSSSDTTTGEWGDPFEIVHSGNYNSIIGTDYITTNTNQTGLSGNKITSGVWTYESTTAVPLRIENTNTSNLSIRYGLNNYFWYAGLANKDIYAIGNASSSLSTLSNRLFWIDNTGRVFSKNGFAINGQDDTQILLAGGGYRPVSDFGLASDIPNISGLVPYTGATTNVSLGGNHLSAWSVSTNAGSSHYSYNTAVSSSNPKPLLNVDKTNIGTTATSYAYIVRLSTLGTAATTGRAIGVYYNANAWHLVRLSSTIVKSSSVATMEIVDGVPCIVTAHSSSYTISATVEAIKVNPSRNSTDIFGPNYDVMDERYAMSSDLSGYVPTSRTITAGNGLSGGGSLASNRTITLGTPGAITLSSTNSVQSSSHTHAFTPGGTTAQYIRGDGSLATFPTSQDSIFAYSPQGGLYTTNWSSNALGQYSLAIGHASNSTAQNATAVGSAVFTGGFGSTNVGFSSNVNKSLAGNFGTYNTNNHRESFTYGLGLQSASTWQTVIGRYNKPNGAGDIDNWTDIRNPIFILGVGQDEMNRKNSVSAFGDGRLDYEIDRDDTYWNDNTLPDIRWINENVGGGGGGGNMNYAYIDHTNTHVFGADEANGLLIPSSLAFGGPFVDPDLGVVEVFTSHDDLGRYSTPTVDTFFNAIAVAVERDILVRRGCISLGKYDIKKELSGKDKLVMVYNRRDDVLSLEWMGSLQIMELQEGSGLHGVLIGNAFNDSTGDAYFNVNPQIL